MRASLRTWCGTAALAVLALAAHANPRRGREISDGGAPPWQVQFHGVLESVRGNRLRVGRNTVVLPGDIHALRMDDGGCPDPREYSRACCASGSGTRWTARSARTGRCSRSTST
jgi:hypothetical protein